MHRFFIAPENWNPEDLILTGAEVHHARDVLRMNPGAKAVLFNGRGHEITAEVIEVGRDNIRLRKLHETETPPLRCRITLGQAIPKGKNMDLIVQKAVEIGAAEIAPLISERTIVDLDTKEAEQKRAKWQQVAIEAAKQCGQNWLPHVHTPRKLKDFFSSSTVAAVYDRRPDAKPPQIRNPQSAIRNSDLRLIGSLQSDAQHLKNILADYASEYDTRNRSPLPRSPLDEAIEGEGSCAAGGRHVVGASSEGENFHERPTSVLMLIGPEGDFTPAELALARSHGCQPITLGPIILRVETAAIYCLSVLSYELL